MSAPQHSAGALSICFEADYQSLLARSEIYAKVSNLPDQDVPSDPAGTGAVTGT